MSLCGCLTRRVNVRKSLDTKKKMLIVTVWNHKETISQQLCIPERSVRKTPSPTRFAFTPCELRTSLPAAAVALQLSWSALPHERTDLTQNYYLRRKKYTPHDEGGVCVEIESAHTHARPPAHVHEDLPTSAAIQETIHPTPGPADNFSVMKLIWVISSEAAFFFLCCYWIQQQLQKKKQ